MEHTITEDGSLTVISLEGEIDLEYSSQVREILLGTFGENNRAIIVDLSGVLMIDSSGVASLLEGFQSAKKRGKEFILAGPGESVLRVLKLARLDTVFTLADDVDSAKSAAG
ncbi:MAG: STAS domain-containing protein [Rhodospirillales bacterium]|nr:STAS domain-containing protein [Rhodospirillales bacterium]